LRKKLDERQEAIPDRCNRNNHFINRMLNRQRMCPLNNNQNHKCGLPATIAGKENLFLVFYICERQNGINFAMDLL